MSGNLVIGYWISNKKRQKFNWSEFQEVCKNEGFILKMINVETSLESQGPIHVFLHKLTDTLAHAECGEPCAKVVVDHVQGYIRKHPELIVIDPLDNIKNLRNRHKSYEMIEDKMQLNEAFMPHFVELRSKSVAENLSLLKRKSVKFPFLCKPLAAHGSSDAHKMMLIFNEKGLKDCQTPCVAQDFVNHNAILYKLFVVGNNFRVIERPSLKNFYAKDCTTQDTLFFSSHDISKSGSSSEWTVISQDEMDLRIEPNCEIFEKIVKRVSQIFGLVLLGIDVVIENKTGKYAVIDVNVFPGYDGYPNFFENLVDTIKSLISKRSIAELSTSETMLRKCLSDDLDSGFESDDKKKSLN